MVMRRSDALRDPVRAGRDVRVDAAVLRRAEAWLQHSGICVRNGVGASAGAVYSYYDTQRRAHTLLYAEAAGYLLSLCRYLHHVGCGGDWIALGQAGGEWLLSLVEPSRGALVMGLRGGVVLDQVYAFDNGVCCKGLLDLHEMTGIPGYVEQAERVASWLVRDALNEDGSVKPVLDLSLGRFVENRRAWFMVSGSFQAKIAMPLLQLSSLLGGQGFRQAAVRICEWALAQQRPDGGFPANKLARRVNLHAHLYTVEALLYAYAIEGRDDFLTAAARGLVWAAARQRADGGILLWSNARWGPTATYAVAQAVRAFLLLDLLKPDERLREAAAAGAEFLVRMQADGPDAAVRGGFFEERRGEIGLGSRNSHRVTSWTTMFAVHALHLLSRRGASFTEEIKFLF